MGRKLMNLANNTAPTTNVHVMKKNINHLMKGTDLVHENINNKYIC